MKHVLTILCCLLFLYTKPQNCLVVYDDIEAYDWTGAGWAVGYPTTGFYSNASVTPTLSAVLYGTGTGTSVIEQGFYILPSAAPISAAYSHRLSFRLGSYRFTAPTSLAAGVDGADYLEVQVSTNGGPYVSELRITGNANAYWTYASTAVANKTISGALTTIAPAGGGDRTTTGDGYSYINVTIPAGPTQVAFRIYARVNAAGEEWWIDDIELNQLAPCVVLPIILTSFKVTNKNYYNIVNWKTTSELNNQHFTLYRSIDGIIWNEIVVLEGAGTTSTSQEYTYKDKDYPETINYYKLTQTDYNGVVTEFDIIYINNTNTKNLKIVKIVNIFGQEVQFGSPGYKFYIYEDGTSRMVIN